METDVEAYLRRRYENEIANIELLEKEDLDLVSIWWLGFSTPTLYYDQLITISRIKCDVQSLNY